MPNTQATTAALRKSLTIDWAVRGNVRPHLRVIVKCMPRTYGNPVGKQRKAVQTALERTALLSHAHTSRRGANPGRLIGQLHRPRVEDVAQPVTEHVGGEDDAHRYKPWEQGNPPGGVDETPPLGHNAAPSWRRHPRPQE